MNSDVLLSAASRMLRSGIPLPVISDMLGHKEKKKGACHREQFVNKSSFGLTGIVLRHIIRKIVFIGKAVYYDDQRPYIYQDQRT